MIARLIVCVSDPNQAVQMPQPEVDALQPNLGAEQTMPVPQTAPMTHQGQPMDPSITPAGGLMEGDASAPASMPVPDTAPLADGSIPISMPLPTEKALPEPPRPSEIPAHLLSGTAITHQSVRHPRAPSPYRPPLYNPLPEPPIDVYDTPRYRGLVQGLGVKMGLPVQVYPDGWFDKENHHHNHHHDHDYDHSHGKSLLSRLFGQHGNSATRRKHRSSIPSFSPQSSLPDSTSYYTDPNGFPIPRSTSMRVPPSHSAPAVRPIAPTYHFRSHSTPMSGLPFSNPQFLSGPPIKFDSHTNNTAFCHYSPHTVLYKKKLYPTALHLLEAFKFLGKRNDLAKMVRTTEGIRAVLALTRRLAERVRKDWDQIVREKVFLSFHCHTHHIYEKTFVPDGRSPISQIQSTC